MPTNTFTALPAAKKQRLLRAAWQEFSQYSFADSSINRIVHAAGISRGSFYQYFADKDDLFSLLLQEAEDEAWAFLLHLLKENGGSLPDALLAFYQSLFLVHTVPDRSAARMQALLQKNPRLDWHPLWGGKGGLWVPRKIETICARTYHLSKDAAALFFCVFADLCKSVFFRPDTAAQTQHELTRIMCALFRPDVSGG